MARNREVARKDTVLRGRAARESGPAREVMRAGVGSEDGREPEVTGESGRKRKESGHLLRC